jgi:hypothetical protein
MPAFLLHPIFRTGFIFVLMTIVLMVTLVAATHH